MANIIQPCCTEQQLTRLLREEKGHAVTFQTYGDVTLEHLMKAVMLMSGDRPRTLTLAVPSLTDTMMHVVGRYLKLEWVTTLRLLTAEPLTDVQGLAAIVGCDVATLMPRLELAADAMAQDGLLAFSGPNGMVVIQGRILDAVTPGLTLYTGVFGREDSVSVRSITDAWNANFRARRYLLNDQTTNLPNDNVNVNDNQQKKQKRKKENKNEPTEQVAGVSPEKENTEAAGTATADVGMAGEGV